MVGGLFGVLLLALAAVVAGSERRASSAAAPPPPVVEVAPAIVSRSNGRSSAIIAVYQLLGSNAVKTAKAVRKLVAHMKASFPRA
jgi:hypothetical protein